MARSLRSALATALEDPDGGPSSATVSSIALFQMSVSKYCTSQHKHATMPVHYEYPVRNGTDILSYFRGTFEGRLLSKVSVHYFTSFFWGDLYFESTFV